MGRWPRIAALAVTVAAGSGILFLVLLDNVFLPWIVDVPMVTVPDLRGRSGAEARQRIARKGLRLALRDSVYSETEAVGDIVDQMPGPGERIKRARRVFVDISRGQRLYEVPQVTGGSLREAQLQIAGLQLRLGSVRFSSHTDIPAGVVARQQPPAGTRARRGTRVDLEVSSGSPFADKSVPDLVGLSIDVVEDSLQKYEMTLGQVRDRIAELLPAGQVLAQQPEGGSMAPRQTAVDLVVSVRRTGDRDDPESP